MQIIVPDTIPIMTFRQIILESPFLGLIQYLREQCVRIIDHGGDKVVIALSENKGKLV